MKRLVLIVNSRDPGEIELARRGPLLFSAVMGAGLSAAVCNCTLSTGEGPTSEELPVAVFGSESAAKQTCGVE